MKTTLRGIVAFALFSVPLAVLAGGDVSSAIKAINDKKYEEAVKILKPLADGGNPTAQLELANLLYNGRGMKEDEKAAVGLYTKSAEQGNNEAMFQLGNAFTFGNDTPRLVNDADAEAAKWYFKAASAGHKDAAYSLGLLFLAGKGVQKNESEALVWMKKAANAGHKDAQSYVQVRPAKH